MSTEVHWLTGVNNPEAVRGLYRSDPELTGGRLVVVTVKANPASVGLWIDLPAYPDQPPERWVRNQANVAQIQIDLFDLQRFQCIGWPDPSPITATLTRDPAGQHTLTITSLTSQISVTYGFARIAHVSGYHDAEPPRA